MYNEHIYLSVEEILNHDFKIDARGYRPQEVDKYLDMVIRDYSEYNNIIKHKNNEINELTSEIYTLKQEIRKLEAELDAEKRENASRPQSVTNVDLLRRISQLEKVVYGSKREN